MSRLARKPGVVAAVALALVALAAGAANAALVKVGDLVLRADGGFTPLKLPQKAFAPIHFQGHADLSTRSGAVPPALQQAVIEFDRDGRMSTGGLAKCAPEQVADSSPEAARVACRAAIVGRGRVEALVALPGQPAVEAESPLTLFNGPRQGGGATVVVHAQMTSPALQTFAILVPVERRAGRFRYRATLDVPAIAGGAGALTRVAAKVGRRYTSQGKRRSYVSARCSDSVLETRGRFTFGDGTIIEGSVMKGCYVRNGP
jgi:hypothetical protein